jgi:hypothetical protein
MSATQIQQEKQNFLNALNSGQITFEQYQQAMAVYKNQPSISNAQIPEAENPYADTATNKFSSERYTQNQLATLANSQVPIEQRQAIVETVAKQEQSVEAAKQLNLPSEIGQKYDLTNVVLPPNSVITGYKEVEMAGPIQQGQNRPTVLQITLTSTQSQQAQQTVTGAPNSLSQQIIN